MWIYLKTWVYIFAALSYAFTGNFYLTYLFTLLSEGFQTLLYPNPLNNYYEQNNLRLFIVKDTLASVTTSGIASMVIVLLIYATDGMVYIGNTRIFTLSVLFFFLCCSRAGFLLESKIGAICILLCVFGSIFSLVFLIDENYYGVNETSVTFLSYAVGTIILSTIYFSIISMTRFQTKALSPDAMGYMFFGIHSVIMIVIIWAFWDGNEDRRFMYYISI